MKTFNSLFLFLGALFILTTFSQCELVEDDPVEGCTDSRALNHSFLADQDDGSCEYSTVVFYARHPAFNGIAIASIEVLVDGNNIGRLSAVYPSAPGNCSAPGTVSYQFFEGGTVDWNARIVLATGAELFSSGTAKPRGRSECIKVNVTK